MSTKKSVLSVVSLATGKTFLGYLEDGGIAAAYEIGSHSQINENLISKYVKEKNLGNLSSRHLSAVADYDSRYLTAQEQAVVAFVEGNFKLAKNQAKAMMENDCFDRLFGKK